MNVKFTVAETLHAGSQEEIVKRIIELIKHEGDVINDKVKFSNELIIELKEFFFLKY